MWMDNCDWAVNVGTWSYLCGIALRRRVVTPEASLDAFSLDHQIY